MQACAWPVGCFEWSVTDDPDGVCAYHRKVLEGLITPNLHEEDELWTPPPRKPRVHKRWRSQQRFFQEETEPEQPN
jgi:hypothetical protein